MTQKDSSVEPEIDINRLKYNKDWYFNFISEWDTLFSRNTEATTNEKQREYLQELSLRLKANTNNSNTRLLDDLEIDTFWKGVHKNLQSIDNASIINSEGIYNNALKRYLLELKGSLLKSIYKSNDLIINADNVFFTRASDRDVFIEMMSHDKKTNQLTIMGCFIFPLENEKGTHLEATINNRKITLKDSGLYSDYKIFGKPVYHKFPFKIELNLSETMPVNISIALVNKEHSTRVPLNLHFNTRMSKLAGRITYWRFASYLATHDKYTIKFRKNNPLETLVREVIFLSAITILWRRPRTAILRIMYWLSRPFLSRRNIWMFADKIYKAGDNAEWLYRYAMKQNDGIAKYYVLRDDSPDVALFKKDKLHYLKYKTIKQRLLFLNANIIVFTHNNAPGFYRFAKANEVYFRGLFNYDIMYIQHGLTVQETSWLFKKSEDDFRRFFIASKFEADNLLRPAYGFKKSEIIKAGAARYDGLVSNDKKNILISPTWRTYLAPPGKDYGESRDANEEFKKSDFYKIYKSLITNKKLIESAKKNGYSITYLLHPVMSSQIGDFDNNGFVKVVTANDDFNYQKAMTEASLMVTDYSGVQFDFAYMYKPVVYFHPPELPASYDEAIYRYDKHALGDIVTKLDELVDLMCDYMNSGCTIKPEYKKRIDDFFYHHDHKNSQRTYDEIIRWQNS